MMAYLNDPYAPLRTLLRERRKMLGMTQEEVGKRMRSTGQGVSFLEKGYPRFPDTRKVKAWCEALLCDITFEATVRFEYDYALPPLTIDVTPTTTETPSSDPDPEPTSDPQP